ncbi:MAG: 30S ribosomal protein S1 [Phycisphaerae bacterium]|nr:30S ribosomal protein S1 [Phycisphaerae bacterium]
MVDHNLIQELQTEDLGADSLMQEALKIGEDLESLLSEKAAEFNPGTILQGKVVNFAGDDVVIDVGFKSEGLVNKNEFDNFGQIKSGDEFEVLLEGLDAETGLIRLSKRKADRIRGWERIVAEKGEGDLVEGKVMRKIKGGLLVDIGVPVFLPASQVDIRRPPDIGVYIGRNIQAQVLKIDTERRNIVISRRKLVEEERQKARETLMTTLKEGDVVPGVVKNLADFGAFVDIGGLDGLLHITDMSWGRINHPSEMLRIDDKIQVKVLNIDREKEKIALGLKQTEPNPWDQIADKYPVGQKVKGSVVNLVSYGAFLKLEDGIEGLIHISEMSWTRRVNHPSELLNAGDEVEVVVLDINKDKHEISLGMKQAEANPWETVAEKYPPGTVVEGIVRNLTNYGAFVEIEPGVDGMLHASDLSWTKKIAHPNEVLKKSDQVKCVVLEVDQSKQRISLGVKQLTEDPWIEAIPTHYQPGMVVSGNVTKITNFGVFVELEEQLEGLLHISELADHKVEAPQDVVKPGQELEVKILRVDVEERKIGLSLKRAKGPGAEDAGDALAAAAGGAAPTRGGMEGSDAVLGTDKITFGAGGASTTGSSSDDAPAAEEPAGEAESTDEGG